MRPRYSDRVMTMMIRMRWTWCANVLGSQQQRIAGTRVQRGAVSVMLGSVVCWGVVNHS